MLHTRRSLLSAQPLLDIASYARIGPSSGRRLTQPELAFIARTVGRAPEVMVKVLTKGGQDIGAVRRHFDYLSRKGELNLESEDGQLTGVDKNRKPLVEEWDLDLEEYRRHSQLVPRVRRTKPKLVHKLVFSMPAGTPSDKLLSAVRTFCREEFAFQHRYAMVLHTDEPHPHVHVVVKAVSEEGERLNIRKADLRAWRQEFARHLRANGVAANATERAVRGADGLRMKDGIYRAMLRGQSTHLQGRVQDISGQLRRGALKMEPGMQRLSDTRAAVIEGWTAVSGILEMMGRRQLSIEVWKFSRGLGAARSDRDVLANSVRPQHMLVELEMMR